MRRAKVNAARSYAGSECVHASYRHIASPFVLLSLAVLAFFAGLSCLAWELGELSSPFLFLNSLVPFFGTLLLLAASSLMSSPTADGLLFRLTSLPFFPPPAVRLCCFLLRGEWPLSWQNTQKRHTKHIIFKSINWMSTCGTAMLSFDNYMGWGPLRSTATVKKRISLIKWQKKRVSARWINTLLVYLRYTSGTKPVAVRYCSDLGFMAVCVAAFVTAIAE